MLQKYISVDQLPAMYGGNQYAPDPECSDYIKRGRDVPTKYYFSNKVFKEAGWEKKVAKRGSSLKVRHKVMEPGCTLQWEFYSTDHGITFGLTLNHMVAGRKSKEKIVRRDTNGSTPP